MHFSFNTPCPYKPPLIYVPPFQLIDLWLTELTPTHSTISYGNIFDLHPLSQEHNYGKIGLCFFFM